MVACAASSTRAVVNSCRLGKSKTAQFNYVSSAQASGLGGCKGSHLISHSTVCPRPPRAVAPLLTERLKGRETRNLPLLLSSAIMACSLGFVTAERSTRSDSLSATSTSAKSRFGPSMGGNGGGSSSKPLGAVSNKRATAEKDIQRLEEEAATDPYELSIVALQGARWTMEDAYSIENGGRFVAVFDGHGGSDVSTMLRERLYQLYRNQLAERHCMARSDSDLNTLRRVPSASSHTGAIRGALEEVETNVLIQEDLVYQGSTAVVVIIHLGDDGAKTLLSANVGDSRAVLSRNTEAVELTRDHKPNDEREKARIRALGEDVEWDPYGQLFRVRDLSLSRAIGDRFAKPAVSSEAEIKHFPLLEGQDEFIILASDGLWDVMSSQEAVDYVHESLRNDDIKLKDHVPRESIARKVANEALERGSADNVCVVIVWLCNKASKN